MSAATGNSLTTCNEVEQYSRYLLMHVQFAVFDHS